LWTPFTGLDNPYIYNPVVTLYGLEGDTAMYVVTATDSIGCSGTDSIKIVIFKTLPDIFVPTAFTPNGDGRNDILKAIPVGIQTFEYFNIYNRYGQLLFTTPDPERGWDGNVNGSKQPSGTYVYMARGISYQNRIIFKKGTVVLIR
jgi:gliding motility-associated-like protein